MPVLSLNPHLIPGPSWFPQKCSHSKAQPSSDYHVILLLNTNEGVLMTLTIKTVLTAVVLVPVLTFGSDMTSRESDSLALVAIKEANPGNFSDGTTDISWRKDQTLDQWEGVTISNNRVTALYLDYLRKIPATIGNLSELNKLEIFGGEDVELSSRIGDLSNLKSLIIEICRLKTVPVEIWNLTNLEELKLRGMELTEIPPEIGHLTNLKSLNLAMNKITSLPAELGDLTNLEHLNFSENELTTLPGEIGSLLKLKTLNASNCQLTALPATIGDLSELEELVLWLNSLTELPASITNLIKLKQLNASYNNIISLPEKIGNLNQLNYLNLDNNSLTELPQEIGLLQELTYLSISENSLSELPQEIGSFTQLELLYVSDNRLNSLPDQICNLTELLGLHITRNSIEALPDSIGKLTKLQNMYFSENQLTTLPASIVNTSPTITEYLSGYGDYTFVEYHYSLNLRKNNLQPDQLDKSVTLWLDTYFPDWHKTQSGTTSLSSAGQKNSLKSVTAGYANQTLHFSHSLPKGSSISVFDLSGRRIVHRGIEGKSVALPSLAKGVYVTRLASNGVVHSRTFVVK